MRLSTDGVLSGNLPAAGTYMFNVTVLDSAQGSASGTFTIVVTNELRFSTPSTLTPTYVGLNYQTALRAKRRSGSSYVFTVTAGSALPSGLALSSAGVLSGRSTASGTFHFNVTVTDSASSTAGQDFSLAINPGVSITTPAVLPAATVGVAYSQSLTATGGWGSGYIWTLTSGGTSLSAVGLSFSNGVIAGTPTSMGSASIAVSVTDTSLSRASRTFTLAVNSPGPGHPLSGQVSLGNACGAVTVPPITLSIDSNPAQTATTDNSGNYTFTNVPDGSYTITPSVTGANSIFYPATLSATVNGGALTGQNFVESLAYNVSGSVSYSGPETGQIYIWLLNKNCAANPLGTSIAAPGSFTIEGVPPGAYQLGAALDALGFGYQNGMDAAGLAASDVAVVDSDVTGTSITMTDPAEAALPAAGPVIDAITANDNGVVVKFEPIIAAQPVFELVELPTSYEVQWGTSSPFGTPAGSATFKAGASNGTNVIFLNDPNLVPGSTYYFRMRGVNQAGNGAWTDYTKLTVLAPGGNLVTGQQRHHRSGRYLQHPREQHQLDAGRRGDDGPGHRPGNTSQFDVKEGYKLPVAVRLMSGPHILHPVDLWQVS